TEHPAKVERIEGSDLHRVILTEKAISRIGLKTAVVREEEVTPTRTVWGEVVPLPAAAPAEKPKGWVRVRLLADELLTLARGLPARVLDGDDDDDDGAVTAQAIKEEDDDGEEDSDHERDDEKSRSGYGGSSAGGSQIVAARSKHAAGKQAKGKRVYYAVEGESRGWVPDQRV